MTRSPERRSTSDHRRVASLPAGHRIWAMRDADLEAVSRIEADSQSHPWHLEQFRAELRNPAAAVDLYWIDENLAGYLCTWLIAGELQIQNLATAPAYRRRGVGRGLLDHVLRRSRQAGLEATWLEVRTSNAGAIALYTTFGFRQVGCRKGYYPDGEDAVVMTLSPAGPSAGAEI